MRWLKIKRRDGTIDYINLDKIYAVAFYKNKVEFYTEVFESETIYYEDIEEVGFIRKEIAQMKICSDLIERIKGKKKEEEGEEK